MFRNIIAFNQQLSLPHNRSEWIVQLVSHSGSQFANGCQLVSQKHLLLHLLAFSYIVKNPPKTYYYSMAVKLGSYRCLDKSPPAVFGCIFPGKPLGWLARPKNPVGRSIYFPGIYFIIGISAIIGP